MEVLSLILGALSQGTSAVRNVIHIAGSIGEYLRTRARTEKPSKVFEFIQKLGVVSEPDVRAAVAKWPAPAGFTAEHRAELIRLLTNLVRGARFHTTNGTTLSNYVRCERLIEQLLQNIQPKLTHGESRGDWRLTKFLGMGSFGEVWKAENKHFPKPRAFKFFTLDGAAEWLEKEGRALSAVLTELAGCQNVIRFENIHATAKPYPWLETEFVGGGSLEDWILDSNSERRRLDANEIMRGVIEGMAAAHGESIYHRDLKPANILLTDDPEPVPKVADFGLGKVDDTPDGRSSYGSAGFVVGTHLYHPPEAADRLQPPDPAGYDVFALGVIWYQLHVGRLERPPYDFALILEEEGAGPRAIRMITKCLARPDRRYADACEMLAEFERPESGWNPLPTGCYDISAIAEKYLEAVSG